MTICELEIAQSEWNAFGNSCLFGSHGISGKQYGYDYGWVGYRSFGFGNVVTSIVYPPYHRT